MRIAAATRIWFALGAALLLTAGAASAKRAPKPAAKPAVAAPAPTSSPEVRYQQTTRYDFDNDLVEGEFATPEDILVDSARHPAFGSMLHPRATFLDEMLKSAQDQ